MTEIGAVWLGYHPRYRQPEFEHVTRIAEPKVLVASRNIDGRDYSGELSALATEFGCIEHVVVLDDAPHTHFSAHCFLERRRDVSDETLARARHAITADDTAVVIFTSGTTGDPKERW